MKLHLPQANFVIYNTTTITTTIAAAAAAATTTTTTTTTTTITTNNNNNKTRHLHAHDALVILKNSVAMPKLLYLLRTSECGDNALLDQFDTILRKGLTEILNVDLSDDQWLQASLPVRDGGLGIRSVRMLAPSAFLASAASTLLLQQSIFPDGTWAADDQAIQCTESLWTN